MCVWVCVGVWVGGFKRASVVRRLTERPLRRRQNAFPVLLALLLRLQLCPQLRSMTGMLRNSWQMPQRSSASIACGERRVREEERQ